MKKPEFERYTILVIPEGSDETRTYRVSRRAVRAAGWGGAALGVLLVGVLASWWFVAARAARVGPLEDRVEDLLQDSARVEDLARRLVNIEARYERIRDLLGASATGQPSRIWLPPAAGARPGRAARQSASQSPPTSWPLTRRGFVTQGLLDEAGGDHPGLDVAVPADSYIRAAGAGTVVDVGDDDVYGLFVVIDHGDGYTSLYGHANQTFVERGQRVREREVIALSGSTGHSTAPHLHFEILRDGEAVDPLTMVIQP